MISTQDALKIILQKTRPQGTQSIPLARAGGYCLASDMRADRDLPPTHRAAMDGYALRAADVQDLPAGLALIGEAAAGSTGSSKVTAGTCVSIFTGAVVPPGADAVAKVEQTQEAHDVVTVQEPVKMGDNIRKRGEETKKGSTVLAKGTVLGPVQIGLCAAVGKAVLQVYRRPRVAVICTGSELVKPEGPVKPWQIRDSNGPALCAALANAFCDKPFYRIVQDSEAALRRTLKTALRSRDIVLLSGGVSVGRYDLVPQIVKAVGARVQFHKVAIKPGKPLLYATIGRNQHIFGLPGNPLSVLNGFHEFVLPAIRRLSGFSVKGCRPSNRLPLAETVTPKGKRMEHILVRAVQTETGPHVAPVLSHGSADLLAAAQADGVVILPRDRHKCQAGCHVEFRSWRPLP